MWSLPSIPGLRGPGGGLVVTHTDKASLRFLNLTVSSSTSSSSLSSCVQFSTPVLIHLLLDLDSYWGIDFLGVLPLFYKSGCQYCTDSSRIDFLCIGALQISQLFLQQLPPRTMRITAQYQSHQFCAKCSRSLFLTSCLVFRRNLVCSQLISLSLYSKVWAVLMHC